MKLGEEKPAFLTDCREGLKYAMKSEKNENATEIVFPEFLKNLGPRSISWTTTLVTNIVNTNNIPKDWREYKVKIILKPNKDHPNTNIAAIYQPITFSKDKS